MTEDRFVLPYFECVACGNSVLSEKRACPKCGGLTLQKKESRRTGTVINSAVTYFPPKNYEHIAPYTSVLVKMAEGFRMFGIMKGEVKDLARGTPLIAVRADEKGGAIIFARP